MIKNVFLLAALSLCLFQSCDNDDNEPVPGYVSAETKAAFDEKYPAAKDVEWETRNDYLIVDFKQDKVEKEAWFDNSGTWYMTETDIPFAQLPDAVKRVVHTLQFQRKLLLIIHVAQRAAAAAGVCRAIRRFPGG